jgi:DNA-binding CsgD family transcriptional regulator
MTERSMDRRAHPVVGGDRDPSRIARLMATGTSVLVAGSLGSGKSHLLATVAQELERGGLPPVFIRPGRPLRDVPFGALDTCADSRSDVLRTEDAAPLDRPLVVVVDDAHSLDADSADTIVRAIYRRRAVALLGIEVPRARAGSRQSDSDAANAFVELWLHGHAERFDLRELTPHDAELLLDQFPGAEHFDAVARATVISLADGSRILLRELAAEASSAISSGRDPLDVLTRIHRHSRVGDALVAHVRELAPAERLTLAVLARLPRIDHADATRLLPVGTIDGLVAAGLIHEDGTTRRRLFVNTALAGESVYQVDPGAVDDVITRAAIRMLDADGTWWSVPLAVAIAERWHGDMLALPSFGLTPPELRVRIATDAARWANDIGEPTLALAYASLVGGDEDESGALLLERTQAELKVTGATAGLARLDPEKLGPSALRRLLRRRVHLGAGSDAVELRARLAPIYADDPRTLADLDLAVAESASMQLDWVGADAAAASAADRVGVDGVTLLRALVVSTLARIHDGDWAGTTVYLERMQRLVRAPGAPASLGTPERVLALCIEMIAAQMAGLEAGSARARLRDETILAAREGSRLAIVLAGLGAALVHARSGDAERAQAEVEAAAHRSANLALGPCTPVIQLSVARSLSLLGRPDQARVIMRRTADAALRPSPLLTQALSLTESCILAAEGRGDDAIEFAEAAGELSDRAGARLLHLRDLYQLAALGAADDVVLHRMRRIAESTDITAAHALAERAADVSRGRRTMSRRTPVERLRLGAPWSAAAEVDSSVEGGMAASTRSLSGAPPTGVPTLPGAMTSSAVLGLTRREREIADLVGEGLSNREIAERLFVSVRTVESHLYQARTKVGARSRTELARMIGARGDGTHGRR